MGEFLLDTHTLLWWLNDDPALSRPAANAIGDPANTIYVSAASIWEIATKVRIGKLTDNSQIVARMPSLLQAEKFTGLPIGLEHARMAGSMAGQHRDPFDRMLAAQASLDGLTLISNDRAFDGFDIDRLW